jgi:hypothetical protein
MPVVHLGYALPIFCADAGEAPVKGAFYATTKGSVLSKIAKVVFADSSAWKILNMNAWNRDNLVYRADSTDCNSAKRDPLAALTTISPLVSAKSAFISLCQRDAKTVPSIPSRTFAYPVIWIPDPDKMINPVRPGTEPEISPIKPTVVINPIKPLIIPSTTPSTPGGDGSGTRTTTGGGSTSPSTPTKTASKTAGIGLILGGLAALAALVFWPAKKGKR